MQNLDLKSPRCVVYTDLAEIAAWCRGDLGYVYSGQDEAGIDYIQVDTLMLSNVEQNRAYISNWIVPRGSTFQIMTDEEYRSTFAIAQSNREQYAAVVELVEAAIHEALESRMLRSDIRLIAENATINIMNLGK